MRQQRLRAAALVGMVAVAACSGGDDEPTVKGRFLDAAVEGLNWTAAPSGGAGTTNVQGEFDCALGDTLSFTLGGVALGSAGCAATLTPMDLAASTSLADAKVANRLLFLQALDDDDTPANGIRIAAAVTAALAGKAIDFGATAAAFDAALALLLPAGVNDVYGQPYSARKPASRRAGAVEHFEGTLAGALGRTATSTSTQAAAGGDVTIAKHTLAADFSFYVPYDGSNAAAKKEFPNGFFPAVGSGLAFKGKAADGSLEFYGITDRGPNGDSPNAPTPANPAVAAITKMFPAPGFAPSIGVISVGKDGALLKSLLPLKADAATKLTGRPPPVGAVGNSGETPLTDELRYDAARVGFDANGLDSESLVWDAAKNVFWTSDEYGPFIARIDAATGVVQKRYGPGTGAADLPAVLKHRRANRGMEGLAMDTATGRLHGFLQSPIDPLTTAGASVTALDAFDLDLDGSATDRVLLRNHALFARWLEFDPATETSRLYAYPLSYPLAAIGAKWDRNRTGSAKLGDLVSLGGGKFIVIEQGADGDGAVRNFLMLVEVPVNATNIAAMGIELEANSIDGSTVVAATWTNVVKLKKTVLLDLNAAGWVAEKAEGLTLVDGQTLALINDNDFGLRATLIDAAGQSLDGDPTACTVNLAGAIVGSGCTAGAVSMRATRGTDNERATRLWLLKFPKALASYTLP